MRFIAAIVAFVVTYFAASFAYGELAPFALAGFFRERPALLGFLLFAICLVAAGTAFVFVG